MHRRRERTGEQKDETQGNEWSDVRSVFAKDNPVHTTQSRTMRWQVKDRRLLQGDSGEERRTGYAARLNFPHHHIQQTPRRPYGWE